MLIDKYDLDVVTPPCEPGAERFSAIARLAADMREALPYLNATLRGAVYNAAASALIWRKGGHRVAFHPDHIGISNVADRDAAIREVGGLVKLATLDEPDSGIDTQSLEDSARLIRRMVDEGTTVLLISHRDEVVAQADTASLVCEGRITSTGDPRKVCDHYARHCQLCRGAAKVEMEADYVRL